MSRHKKKGGSRSGGLSRDASADQVMSTLIDRMDDCPTAEALNDEVIMPFILALEKVCEARGYLMNIYGEQSNIVVSTPDDAETIYHLVEEYLDAATKG